jgi:hypothetical protein
MASDSKVLRTINTAVDSMLNWGKVSPILGSISRARHNLLEQQESNESKLSIFTALIDSAMSNSASELEDLL